MISILTRVTAAEARDAADVLRTEAEEARYGSPTVPADFDTRHHHYAARAEAMRRVAEWIEAEALRDA